MTDFAQLGLGTSLVAATEALGFEEPTRLQRAAGPVIRRGGNVVLHASSGAGVTLTWGLPLLDRLATGTAASGEIQALVVVTNDTRASEVADSIARLAHAAGDDAALRALRIRALARGWSDATKAHVLVASLGAVVQALAASELKLGATRAIVLESVAALSALEGDASLDALMVSLPADAQRIATIAEQARSQDRWLETHVRRALHFPSGSAASDGAPGSTGTVSYLVVPEAGKQDALARLLGRPRPAPPIVSTRSAARAKALEAALNNRGFGTSRSSGVQVDAVLSFGVQPPAGTRIAYDAPFDAEGLLALEPEDGLVMVEPREIPHLRQIAKRAGRELRAVGRDRPGRDALASFRADIRRALREEDLELHLTALEPLLAEHPAEEVAAALSALVRRRAPAPSAQSRPSPAGATPFVRIFVSMGQRDGIRPSDLVGVITAEAGIPGDRIGKIEIKDTFSVLEIDPDAAQAVIAKLNGVTVRGRSLRVDYDRRPTARTATTRRRANRPPG